MITKGIIKSLDMNGNTCTVRMPFFETAGNDEIVGYATISNTPGSYNGYKVDDVVWVAFEDGQMDTPVVIGKLYLGVAKEKADPRGTINVVDSITSNSATIPADTKLGATIDTNMPNTKVPYSSMASVANELNTLHNDYSTFSKTIGNQFDSVVKEVTNLGTFASEIKQEADNITLTVKANYDDLNGKYNGLDAKVLEAETQISQLPDSIMATASKKFLVQTSAGEEAHNESFGWDLQFDKWTVFKTSTLGKDERPNPDNVHIGIVTVKDSAWGTYFFTDHQNQWRQNGVFYYLFNSKTGHELAPWPGKNATWVDHNDLGEDVWKVNINTDEYDCIIFNGGWWMTKTVDLLIANMPEAKNAWYPTETEINVDGDVVWKCGYWHKPIPGGGDSKGYKDYITVNGFKTDRPASDVPSSGKIQNISLAAYEDMFWHWNDDNPTWHGLTTGVKADGSRTILEANKDGLIVSGTIRADDGLLGSFNIGKRHQCTALGSTEANPIYASGIYSTGYVDRENLQIHGFEQVPKDGAIGVYVGTDGIRLGDSFWVSHEGEIFASRGTISGDIKVGEFYMYDVKNDGGYHYWWPCTNDSETRNNGRPWTQDMFTQDEWNSATERTLKKVVRQIEYDQDGNAMEFKPYRFRSDEEGVNVYGGMSIYSLRVQAGVVPEEIMNDYLNSSGMDKDGRNSAIIKPECYERPIGSVLAFSVGNNGEYQLGDSIMGVAGYRDIWESATASNSVLYIDAESGKSIGEGESASTMSTNVYIKGATLQNCWINKTRQLSFGNSDWNNAYINGYESSGWTEGDDAYMNVVLDNVESTINYLGYATAFYASVKVTFKVSNYQKTNWQHIASALNDKRNVEFYAGSWYNHIRVRGTTTYQLYIRGCQATSVETKSFTIDLEEEDIKKLAGGGTVVKYWSTKIAERSGWATDYVGAHSMFRPQTNLIVQNASGEPVKFEIGYGKTHYSSDEKEIAFSNTYQSNNNPPYMHYYGQYHEFDGNIIPYGSDDYIGTSGNKWKHIYCDNLNGSTAPSSDRRLKYDITYDISNYDAIFDNLKPTAFKYIKGDVARTHLGLIAQDVEESVFKAGMTRQDMAAIVIDGKGFDKYEDEITDEENTEYSIRYHELHALEIRQIQMLKQRVAELEELVNKLADEKTTKKKNKKED